MSMVVVTCPSRSWPLSGLPSDGRRSSAAWLLLLGLVLCRSSASADDHKVAVNVRVAPGLKLDDSDLSRFVRGQLGRYEGVVALPEGKTRDAIAEERATTNSKCRSGVIDQKCQLALGSALAASHWLEVTVTRPGKKCEVSLEYLSIVRESSDAGDVVAADCDRESVAAGLERAMQTVARKARWADSARASTAGASPEPTHPPEHAAQKPNDAEPADARYSADARAESQTAKERVHAAELLWPDMEALAKNQSTPLQARLDALRAFSAKYAGTRRGQAAEALALSLGAEGELHEAQTRSGEEMTLVPAGSFLFGCNERIDIECDNAERPGRQVTLAAFRIDRTEVTVAAYRACVRAGQCSMPDVGGYEDSCNWDSGRDDHPINCVDWAQAQSYCAWKRKRLPTEEEWEKAARGKDGRKYPWGNSLTSVRPRANMDGADDGWPFTAPVAAYPDGFSPYGTADAAGNVWEWCEDRYPDGSRGLRGGSWRSSARSVRASGRLRLDPGVRAEYAGFRCARSAK
jgi:formylglycine-generating enzyme required for sulfatase activity